MPSPSILLGVGAVLSTLSAPAFAAKYEAQDSYNGRNWLDAFKFETYEKTNGFVNYVDEATAKSMKLYKTEGNDVLFGVDSGETLDSADGGDIGRKSVRLEGKKEYNHGLFIIDVKAMPNVCGMWPAFWSLGREPWPVSDFLLWIILIFANMTALGKGRNRHHRGRQQEHCQQVRLAH